MPCETAAILACSVYLFSTTMLMSHHFMQSYLHKVHVCLVVTCHLHFWLNDWNLVCAFVVVGVEGGGGVDTEMSQHRKLTLEK